MTLLAPRRRSPTPRRRSNRRLRRRMPHESQSGHGEGPRGRRHQKGTTAPGTRPYGVTRTSTATSVNEPAGYRSGRSVRIDTEEIALAGLRQVSEMTEPLTHLPNGRGSSGYAPSRRPPQGAITSARGGKVGGVALRYRGSVAPRADVIGLRQVDEMALRLPGWGRSISGADRLSPPGSRWHAMTRTSSSDDTGRHGTGVEILFRPPSHRLVQCRQEIGSAAMISEAVVGVARFTPVAHPADCASACVPAIAVEVSG
jgi:hypothetical protein